MMGLGQCSGMTPDEFLPRRASQQLVSANGEAGLTVDTLDPPRLSGRDDQAFSHPFDDRAREVDGKRVRGRRSEFGAAVEDGSLVYETPELPVRVVELDRRGRGSDRPQ